VLAGFKRTDREKGYEIFTVKGWDYPALIETYQEAERVCREEHVPVLVHVEEVTQPQGHSTSGSHERYKSKERLAWEIEHDGIVKMRQWIIDEVLVVPEELEAIEQEAKQAARVAKDKAWKAFNAEIQTEFKQVTQLLNDTVKQHDQKEELTEIKDQLVRTINPIWADCIKAAKKALRLMRDEETESRTALVQWLEKMLKESEDRFSSHVYSQSEESAMRVTEVKPIYSETTKEVDGREVLNACFTAAFTRDARIIAFGEDVGKIGDVNQGFVGLQEKFGEWRVTDTGIRECTIIGQGIGAALRGLRPIAEIQYLDYLLYALQIMSDDLACLQYRTKGGQKAPVIIRTRGHRLEGVWHAGSPMGMILHSLRGIYVLVPRNMTQAAGFYNTMLQSDDPALIIECLNGYRLKEQLPDNVGEFTVPLGVPEVIRTGDDVTIVTYGSMCRIVMEATEELERVGISCEVIDVQTLLPFDIHHTIVELVKKTNRVIFADEDVPGGASAFMMQKVLEEQGGYQYLDATPVTITAKEHRPAYASDGDYFSKPNVESIFDTVYALMRENDPSAFPRLY
jgi:pyruvate/2-oxoglutarate/acetoin dehydrogenase E1 component